MKSSFKNKEEVSLCGKDININRLNSDAQCYKQNGYRITDCVTCVYSKSIKKVGMVEFLRMNRNK